jgi:hypothetical protein
VNESEIQDGDWDTATDLMSSVNQWLCWNAGDTLGWGKAQGRAETSALWAPSSWKASPCHDLLKEHPVLHAKPRPIGPRSRCSTGRGISDPSTHSSIPPGPHSPKLPPMRHTRSPPDWPPKACQASDPQAFMISAAMCPSGLHRPAQSGLHQAGPQGLPGLWSTHTMISTPQEAPFRHARPTLQRPTRLPQWQASACRPMEVHPPATSHRRAPNLPRRHRQV